MTLQFMGFPEQLLHLRIFTIWMAKNDFHRHLSHNWIKLELNCQLKIIFPLNFRLVRIVFVCLFVCLFFNNTWGEQSVSAKRYVLKPGTPEHPLGTPLKVPLGSASENIEILGKQNKPFPSETVVNFLFFLFVFFQGVLCFITTWRT